jgi:hypothetical protein
MKILDIQETQSVEFCVNWAAPRPWQQVVTSANVDSLSTFPNQAASLGSADRTCNGYIGVVPFTTLQSPDNSDIEINVYVSSPDMQFNHMINANLPTRRDIYTESENLSMQEVTCYELNESSDDPSVIALDYFGERPLSFRALLKRYTTTDTWSFAADATTRKVFQANRTIYPKLNVEYGDVSSTYPNLLSYLRYAYVGLRGSYRHRLRYYGETGSDLLKFSNVTLDAPSNSSSTSSNISTPKYTSMNGTVTILPHCNGGIEFELPYYSNNLFLFSFADNLVGVNNSMEMEEIFLRKYTHGLTSTIATSDVTVYNDTAPGEDFCLIRFQGAPFYSQTV